MNGPASVFALARYDDDVGGTMSAHGRSSKRRREVHDGQGEAKKHRNCASGPSSISLSNDKSMMSAEYFQDRFHRDDHITKTENREGHALRLVQQPLQSAATSSPKRSTSCTQTLVSLSDRTHEPFPRRAQSPSSI